MEKEEIKTIVDESLKDALKDVKSETATIKTINDTLTQLSARFPVGQDAQKELMHTDPAVAMATFVKALATRDNELLGKVQGKAADPMNVTTSADGAVLIPTIVAPEIRQLVASYNQSLSLCSVMPMQGYGTVTIPAKLTGATTSVVAEANSITSAKPTFTSLSLVPKKFATLTTLSSELVKSAVSPAIGTYLIDIFAQSQGSKLDSLIFQDGSTTWNGLCLAAATYGKAELCGVDSTAAGAVTYQNYLNAAYGVDQAYLVNAEWIMSRTSAAITRGILDGNLRPIFEPAANAMPASILGYPVRVIENCPTAPTTASKTFCMLGNFKNAIIGDVNDYRLDTSNSGYVDATEMFQNDLIAIRMIKAWAFSAGLILAYSQIKTAAA